MAWWISTLIECGNSEFDLRMGKEGIESHIFYKENLQYEIYIKIMYRLKRGNKVAEVFELIHYFSNSLWRITYFAQRKKEHTCNFLNIFFSETFINVEFI